VTPPTAFINAGSSAGWAPIQGAFWRAGAIAPNLELNEVLPRFTREATDVIRRHAAQRPDQPLFLYLALSSPHTPWLPSGEFSGKSGAGMYGDFTMMTDAMVGRVLDTLDATGMAPATLVILSSDNGPVWYERDVDRFGHDSAGPWRGMKGDVWEAGHRVPFIVRWPGRVEPGSSSAQLISFVDVLPTLAAVLGQPLPRGAAPDGKSFHYALTGTVASAHQARTSLIVAARNGTLSYRQGHWKYIAGLGSGGLSPPARRDPAPGEPPVQLYHLERDPAERNNLSKDHPGLVRELERQLAKRLRTD
jgi:arylsulfatase A